jgi:inosine-uridine nucleoside N-ribohydrolase
MDFNIQWDTQAAQTVIDSANNLTFGVLHSTSKAFLCSGDLGRLRDSGPIGKLLAQQGEAYSVDAGNPDAC